MKKIVFMIFTLIIAFSFVSCSTNKDNNVADADKFLSDMADGITERLSASESVDESTLSQSEKKEHYIKLVNYELDKIAKYEKSSFDDKKLNTLAHTYIDSCKAQLSALEFFKNDELYSALWNGGRTLRAGIIVELYESFDLPISKEQADSYRTQKTVTVKVESDVDLNDVLPKEDDDVVLKSGELFLVDGSGNLEGDYFKYVYRVKNTSEHELKSIGAYVSICDSDGNIIGNDSCYLHLTLPAGNVGVLEGSIKKEKLNDAAYIKVDSFNYDGNGNNIVFKLYADKDNAEKTKILIPVEVVEYTTTVSNDKQTVEFDYDKIMSNPTDYEGKYLTLEGQILAKESAGTVMMAFRIDTTPYSFKSDDTIVHVSYVDDYIDTSVYKLGDIVKVHGEFASIGTYDTAYAKNTKMPVIYADTVEVLED